MVPVEGIEPPLLAEHDFESCASTNSATRACFYLYIIRRNIQRAQPAQENRGAVSAESSLAFTSGRRRGAVCGV